MPKTREPSRYARKRAAGIVPHRYSDRYAAWRSDIIAGRDPAESAAAWKERFLP